MAHMIAAAFIANDVQGDGKNISANIPVQVMPVAPNFEENFLQTVVDIGAISQLPGQKPAQIMFIVKNDVF